MTSGHVSATQPGTKNVVRSLAPVEHPEQPRHRDLRPVALVADHIEVVDDLGVVGQHDRLGIDIEREHRGGAVAVGPAETGGHGVHAATILGR